MYNVIFNGNGIDQRVAEKDGEIFFYDYSGCTPDQTDDGPLTVEKPDVIHAYTQNGKARMDFRVSSGPHEGKTVICGEDTGFFMADYWGVEILYGKGDIRNGDV